MRLSSIAVLAVALVLGCDGKTVPDARLPVVDAKLPVPDGPKADRSQTDKTVAKDAAKPKPDGPVAKDVGAKADAAKSDAAKSDANACPNPPLPSSPLGCFQRCQAKADCVLVKQNCCPCSSGGRQVPINKAHGVIWDQKVNCSSGPPPACLTVYLCGSCSAGWSGGTVDCVAGACTLLCP